MKAGGVRLAPRGGCHSLDRWLAGPEGLIPGQKIGVSVSEAKDRADLIEYLKEESRR